MLLYRAQLGAEGATVVAVAVRRRRDRLFRVIVRYAGADGRMQCDRGQVWAEVPAGVDLAVAGYQQSGSELLITLRPVAAPKQSGDAVDGIALADRFRLPVGLQAWGVTALQGARLDLQAVCRCRGGSVLVRGALRLTLVTPGAPFRLRIPFCRMLAAEAPPGLRWRVMAGVTGLHVRVAPGGRIDGEAVVALHCEGRPHGAGAPAAGAAAAGASAGPQLQRVRELTGRIAQVAAELAGDGHALIHGAVDLDLYWFDAGGLSRWTGRQVPFGALAAVEGAAPDDRLEATAVLERLHSRVEAGAVVAHMIVTATVTALRPEVVQLGAGRYRMERVVGVATTTVAVSEELLGGLPLVGGGSRTVPGVLPLPGPAGGWQEVAAVLSTPEAAVGDGAGRWTVRAALGGTPAGEAPYPAPLKAASSGALPLAPRELLTVVPMLEQLDASGLRLRTALTWGPPLPAAGAAPPPPGATAVGTIALPGPVRSVLATGAEGDGGPVRVWALVALEPRGLALVSGSVDPPHRGRPLRLTAIPILDAGEWRLQVALELAASSS